MRFISRCKFWLPGERDTGAQKPSWRGCGRDQRLFPLPISAEALGRMEGTEVVMGRLWEPRSIFRWDSAYIARILVASRTVPVACLGDRPVGGEIVR